MKSFRIILRYAKPYLKYAYLNIFFNLLYAIFSTLSFIAMIPMLNVLFKETKPLYEKPLFADYELKDFLVNYLNYFVTEQTALRGQNVVLLYMIGGVVVIFFLKNLFNYLSMFFITFLQNGLLKDLRLALYDKVITLPVSFFKERKKGDIMARVGSDVMEVQQSFLSVLELLIKDPVTIVITLAMMTYISFNLTIFVLIFIPVSGLIISRIGKSLKNNSEKLQSEQGHFLSIVEETLGGIRIIKTFNAERIFKTKFKISSLRFFRYSNAVKNKYNLASPTSEFLGVLVIGVILFQGGALVLVEKSMTASSFIAYIGLAYNILTPAKSISNSSISIKRGDASAKRIIEILHTKNTITDIDNPVEKNQFEDKIIFDNISFGYDKEKNTIEDFSLEIPKGKMVAIVGPSGSGKTTVANLITRFYDVQKGRIMIDGEDIKTISKKSLRDLISLVSQDTILFNDTVKNNILIGKPEAPMEEIEQAAMVANAHDFIMQLPHRYDTNIGDMGNKLSGGQKQRVSIARAILKNPSIMVLDEATSALDTESEKLVQEALENMMRNRTSIVIAHRLSTIQKSDVILVLQNGKIIEQGTHKDLMKNKKMYEKLVKMQTI